jgi:hypothetical protein
MANEPKGRTKPPTWPTLEEQLVASKVIHGSALEKLIRDNQDFHMLRSEEAHDNLRLPPWLRVLWRKQHPEGNYSASDPSGGYPLLLKDIYSWMTLHQDLPSEPLEAGQATDAPPTSSSTSDRT